MGRPHSFISVWQSVIHGGSVGGLIALASSSLFSISSCLGRFKVLAPSSLQLCLPFPVVSFCSLFRRFLELVLQVLVAVALFSSGFNCSSCFPVSPVSGFWSKRNGLCLVRFHHWVHWTGTCCDYLLLFNLHVLFSFCYVKKMQFLPLMLNSFQSACEFQ